MIEISNMRTNSLGTASFDMKIQGWRKSQEFCVYPISAGGSTKTITIQSDKRYGKMNTELGTMVISKNHNNSCSVHFQLDVAMGKAERHDLNKEQLFELTQFIGKTAKAKAGNNSMGVYTDNSGASNLMSL